MNFFSGPVNTSYLRLNFLVTAIGGESEEKNKFDIEIRIRAEHWDAKSSQFFEKSAKSVLKIDQFESLLTDPDAYGDLLGKQLFSDNELVAFFLQSIQRSRPFPLQLILNTADEHRLADIHWEWLCVPTSQNGVFAFAARDSRICFSLHVGTDVPYEHRIANDSLRAIVVSCCPQGINKSQFTEFDATELASEIPTAFPVALTRWLPFINQRFFAGLTMVSKPGMQQDLWDSVEQLLVERAEGQQFAVFHLICHGIQLNDELVFILSDKDGKFQRVTGQEVIQTFLKVVGSPGLPLLVVLFVCESGKNSSSVGGFAQQLIERCGIPAVIGMRGPVAITAASKICVRFYRELSRHGVVPVALGRALQAIGDHSSELSIVLYSRSAQQSLLSYTREAVLTPKRVWMGAVIMALTLGMYLVASTWHATHMIDFLTNPTELRAVDSIDGVGWHTKYWMKDKLHGLIVNARKLESSYQNTELPQSSDLATCTYKACVGAFALTRMGQPSPMIELLSDFSHPTLRNQVIDLSPRWLADSPSHILCLLDQACEQRRLLFQSHRNEQVMQFDSEVERCHLLQYSLLLAIDAIVLDQWSKEKALLGELLQHDVEGHPFGEWLAMCAELHFDPGVHAASQHLLSHLAADRRLSGTLPSETPASLRWDEKFASKDKSKLSKSLKHYRQWMRFDMGTMEPSNAENEIVGVVYFPPSRDKESVLLGVKATDKNGIRLHKRRISYGFVLFDTEMSVNLFESLSGNKLQDKRDLGYVPESKRDCAYSPFIGREPRWLEELQLCSNKLTDLCFSGDHFWSADVKQDNRYTYLRPEGTDSGFRFPTESEWELAARCNSGGAAFFGYHLLLAPGQLGPVARFVSKREVKQPKCKEKWPSPYGLFDVHGNLSEICMGKHDSNDPQGVEEDNSYRDDSPLPSALQVGRDRLMVRGGDFNTLSEQFLSWRREEISGSPLQDRPHHYYGMRMARTVTSVDFEVGGGN